MLFPRLPVYFSMLPNGCIRNLRVLQGSVPANTDLAADRERRPRRWEFPHGTILPGLQFSLAGILGKPETYFQVPLVHFVFEMFSYV